ncbi:MAG: hypothetical protein H6912_03250 [Kordiimonadaceae bacterium]|nr:hypothetical protein [Kordiimonadaceae bacterium]
MTDQLNNTRFIRPLLRYDLDNIDPSNAMVDRIEIKIPDNILLLEGDQTLEEFVGELATSQYFTSQGGPYTLKVRSNTHHILNGTEIRFYYGENFVKFNIIIVFNPTRLLAHLFEREGEFIETLNSGQTINIDEIFTLQNDIKNQLRRLTLNRNDNFINTASDRYTGFIEQDESSFPSLSVILSWIRFWITERLTEALESPSSRLIFQWEGTVISQTEEYFEFYTANSVDTLSEIAGFLSQIRDVSRYQSYIEQIDSSQEYNSAKLELLYGYDLRLIIYPKTPQILRFEFKKFTSLRSLRPLRSLTASAGLLAFPNRSYNAVPSMLSLFAHFCANELIDIFSAMAAVSQMDEPNPNLLPNFFRAIETVTAGDETAANNIWSLFCTTGRIDATGNPPLRRKCLLIEQMGYIERIGRRVTENEEQEYTSIFILNPVLRSTLEPFLIDRTFGI